jgi:hypothetical protein
MNNLKRKTAFLFLLFFAFSLIGTAFHHHPDGQVHKDCLRCFLGIQSSSCLAPACELLNPLFSHLPWEFSGDSLAISLTALYSQAIRAPPYFLSSVS